MIQQLGTSRGAERGEYGQYSDNIYVLAQNHFPETAGKSHEVKRGEYGQCSHNIYMLANIALLKRMYGKVQLSDLKSSCLANIWFFSRWITVNIKMQCL
jgi:hypothetical protein